MIDYRNETQLDEVRKNTRLDRPKRDLWSTRQSAYLFRQTHFAGDIVKQLSAIRVFHDQHDRSRRVDYLRINLHHITSFKG
jgi:hypothetical protein